MRILSFSPVALLLVATHIATAEILEGSSALRLVNHSSHPHKLSHNATLRIPYVTAHSRAAKGASKHHTHVFAVTHERELCVIFAFFIAGVVQGIAGFGAGLVAMVVVPTSLPMMDTVPVVTLLWLFVTLAVLSSTWTSLRSPRLRKTLPILCAGALIGVPLGVALLTSVDPRLLRIALGASMLIFVVERAVDEFEHGCCSHGATVPSEHARDEAWKKLTAESDIDSQSEAQSDGSTLSPMSIGLTPVFMPTSQSTPVGSASPLGRAAQCEPMQLPSGVLDDMLTRAESAEWPMEPAQRYVDHHLVALLVGVASGVLSGALNEGGPPVVMYLALRRWDKDEVKAALQAFLMLMSVMGLSVQWHRGLLVVRHLQYAAIGMPAAAAGIGLGVRLYDRIDQRAFGRVLTVAMLAMGVAYIVHAGLQLSAQAQGAADK